MVWPLLMFLLLRARRAKHPELFDGAAALAAVEGAISEARAWDRTSSC